MEGAVRHRRREHIPAPQPHCRVTVESKGHVRTQRGAKGGELLAGGSRVPDLRASHESGGGIGAAARHAASYRDALDDCQVHAVGDAVGLSYRASGAHGEVAVVEWNALDVDHLAVDAPVRGGLNRDLDLAVLSQGCSNEVIDVHGLEDGGKGVIAVGLYGSNG